MPLNFRSICKVNEKGAVLSPLELKSLYFYGIPIQEKNGGQMPEGSIETYIRSAQRQVEGFLSLKLDRQIVEERLTFDRDMFMNYNFIQTTYPVRVAYRLQGILAQIKQVEYPKEWLVARETTDGETYHRRVSMIPVGSTVAQTMVFSGTMPYIGFRGRFNIPEYWSIAYSTGYDQIPEDILTAIGKYASIMIFHQLGDIILGAGIASMSLGVDGLSQSISTTSSATNAGYGARITGYINDLKIEMPRLKDKYCGFVFTSL